MIDIKGLSERYEAARALKLDLDMTRGKPSPQQLDLSNTLLTNLGEGDFRSPGGVDCRNYGGLEGLPELRAIWAPYLGVSPDELLIGDNASLSLMHDVIAQAMLRGVPGGNGPWVSDAPVRFLCPTPGYDRHFGICDHLGIEMVQVAMGPQGPDMDQVQTLAGQDPRIKGMFCVPRYSNPTGVTYSDETVNTLAAMAPAAADFRIVWDNAYAGHHLYDTPDPLANILDACRAAGNEERPWIFGSTSKITFAGSGLALMAAAGRNLEELRRFRTKQTIGPDKINQLRHLRMLPDGESIEALMRRHAALLRPRFEVVLEILDEELAAHGVAQWSRPRGGYFISLDTPDGCASGVVKRSAEAGVRLTPAGATFPGGVDPRDRNIRLAPSFPGLDDLRQATRVLAICILLEAAERGHLDQ